jgi:Glyoxalase-like domain
MSHLKDICIDCADPWTLASWWARALAYEIRAHSSEDIEELRAQGIDTPEDDPCIAIDPVDGKGPAIWFNRVPEAKHGKNRVHIDMFGNVEELVAAGATVLERHPNWTVLADPEGNEFCAFPPPHNAEDDQRRTE